MRSSTSDGERVDTRRYDEMRFVVSVWHPRDGKNIDLDKAYLELRANFVGERPLDPAG